MPRQTVSDEVKAAAIADLQTGEAPATVAERYGLNRQTVKAWKLRLTVDVQPPTQPKMQPALQPQPLAQPARPTVKRTLQELVIANLEAKLTATERIAEHVTNPDWLKTQNAAELATLFEVLDRSALGILDRMAQRRAEPEDDHD